MYFGLKTRESLLLLTRDITPQRRVLSKLRALAKSFDYGGRQFETELGNEGQICYGNRFALLILLFYNLVRSVVKAILCITSFFLINLFLTV
jgi:hypothetical protein